MMTDLISVLRLHIGTFLFRPKDQTTLYKYKLLRVSFLYNMRVTLFCLLGHLVILFNRPPKLEACWSSKI